MTKSLCATCTHMREIVSGTGSRFLLCRLAQDNDRFAKYPPQPIIKCDGYQQREGAIPSPSCPVVEQ